MYSVHCIVCTVQCVVCIMYCAVCPCESDCTLHTAPCTLHPAHCTLHTAPHTTAATSVRPTFPPTAPLLAPTVDKITDHRSIYTRQQRAGKQDLLRARLQDLPYRELDLPYREQVSRPFHPERSPERQPTGLDQGGCRLSVCLLLCCWSLGLQGHSGTAAQIGMVFWTVGG